MSLDPDVRRVLESNALAHLATIAADGSPRTVPVWAGTHGDQLVFFTGTRSLKARNLRRDPRLAVSMTAPDDPLYPVLIRGRVVEWLEGDAAWEIVDRISSIYTGGPYPRTDEMVVAVVEIERQSAGMG